MRTSIGLGVVSSLLVLSGTALADSGSQAPPSCQPTKLMCQNESCCTRLPVPSGTLEHTDDNGRPAGRAAVQAFILDKYEVTVGRMRTWVAAGAPTPRIGETLYDDGAGHRVQWTANAHAQTAEQMQGWLRYDTWARNDDTLPKNNVSWFTAAAFCHWEGGRLPTEVEWKYVAVGGDENRAYPWGADAPTPDYAVFNCRGDGRPGCSKQDILPVGSKPRGVGRWGHMDLAGSVFEWTLDQGGSFETETKASRGGGFCYIGGVDRRASTNLRTTVIRRESAQTTSHMVGFRCAYDSSDR